MMNQQGLVTPEEEMLLCGIENDPNFMKVMAPEIEQGAEINEQLKV